MGTETDLLEGVAWECAPTPPGEATGPTGLAGLPLRWIAASVPGTAAGAVRGSSGVEPSSAQLDAEDWWFRCRFAGPDRADPARDGAWLLELEGLATVADVWLNGEHLARSESMFRPCRARVQALRQDNELVICCSALAPRLAERRPRPRWKSAGASHQNLRWFRTTLLGRQPGWTVTPAPVGPWRPVRLRPWGSHQVLSRWLEARPQAGGAGGTVSVELRCTTAPGTVPAGSVEVGGVGAPLAVELAADGGELVARGTVSLAEVARWWPHTHGAQPRYPVSATVGPDRLDLGAVGFRTVEVDEGDGRFQLMVNDVPVFCRGGCWYPMDPVSFAARPGEVEATLTLAREAGLNMVRIPGGTVYEDDRFFAACDRLGIMVWQDAMFAFLDPPDDGEFLAGVTEELTGVFSAAGRPPVGGDGLRGPGARGAAGHVRVVDRQMAFGRDRQGRAGRRRSAPARRSLCDVLPLRGGPPLPGRHRHLPLHRCRCLHPAPLGPASGRSEVRERGPGLRRAPSGHDGRRGVWRGPAGRPRPGLEAGHPSRHGRLVGPRGRAGPLCTPLARRGSGHGAADRSRARPRPRPGRGHHRDGRGRGRVAPPDVTVRRAPPGRAARPPSRRRMGGGRRPRATQGALVRPGPGVPAHRRAAHRRRAQRARRPPGQRHRRRRGRATRALPLLVPTTGSRRPSGWWRFRPEGASRCRPPRCSTGSGT